MSPAKRKSRASLRGQHSGGKFGIERFRARLATVGLGLFVLALACVTSVQLYAIYVRGLSELDGDLIQTVTAFSHTVSRNSDGLSSQVELVAGDSRVASFRSGIRSGSGGESSQALLSEYQHYLTSVLFDTGGDVLLVLDGECRVEASAEKPIAMGEAALVFEPGVSDYEKSNGNNDKALFVPGVKVASPLVSSVFEYRETRTGFVQLQADGEVYAVAVTPLGDDKEHDGVLVLAQRMSSSLLGEWSRGMMDGILAVVREKNVMVAYDKRTAKEPSPALLGSLQKAVENWSVPERVRDTVVTVPDAPPAPGVMLVAGREWKLLSIELNSGDQQIPSVRVLFLSDTSALDYEVSRQFWILLVVDLCLAVVAFLILWFGSSWVSYPLLQHKGRARSASSEFVAYLEPIIHRDKAVGHSHTGKHRDEHPGSH